MISLTAAIFAIVGSILMIVGISFSEKGNKAYKMFFEQPGRVGKTQLDVVRMFDKISNIFMVLGAICLVVAFVTT